MTTLFYNARVLTMTQENPSLLLSAVGVVDSKIAMLSSSEDDIRQFEQQYPSLRKIDCQGKLLMPGLINTHTHVPMALQRGMGDDIELMEWLNTIVWPFESLQSDEDIEAGSRLGIAEMLLGGTTTFVDMYWSEHYVANAVEQMGIRAVLGECCLQGERMENFERNLPQLIKKAASCSRITPAIAPHAPYTCSEEILRRCVELAAENNLPLLIHLAETKDEERIIRELYDLTPTQYLDRCGIIKPSTILAHGIYLDQDDMEIVARKGAHIAHNPQCNMKISSGVAPITTYAEQGINCTIGTDGVCSNNDLDLWDEMRSASFLHKLSSQNPTAMPAYQVLKMATVQAAKAIGREGELGIIAPGAIADIVVLNTNRVHYRPHYDIVSSAVYCSKSSDVEYVMVDGRILVENYQLLDCDIESICQDVERRSSRIMESISRG